MQEIEFPDIPDFLDRRKELKQGTKTMIDHVILKNEGEVIPMSFLKRALEPHPHGVGIAVAGNGRLDLEAYPITKDSAVELNRLINENFKENFVMVQFTKISDPKKNGVDNYGPFISFEMDKFRLAIAGSGLLPAWDNKSDFRSGLNSLNRELIKPFIKGLSGSVRLDGLVNHEGFRGLLESQVNQYGCFVCLDADGYYVFVQGRDLKHRDYSWGWSSRDLGTFDQEMKLQEENKPPVEKITLEEKDVQLTMTVESKPTLRKRLIKSSRKPGVLEVKDKAMLDVPIGRVHSGEGDPEIGKQMKEASNVVTLPDTSLIPENQIEKVQDMSIKYRDEAGREIKSMADINKLLENTPDFEAQTGVDPLETLFYSDEAIKDMQMKCPQAFLELHLAIRRELMLRLREENGSVTFAPVSAEEIAKVA